MDNLSSSELRFLDTLADETAKKLPPERKAEIHPLVVRGSFLRNLLLGKLSTHLLPPNGLVVEGAQIIGNVDLSGCNVTYPITLRGCKVLGILDFTGATIIELVLTGTSVEQLRLSNITCKGGIVLSYGFRTLHPVVARGARIGGQLGCSGGEFLGYPLAISLEAAEIQEAFFWRRIGGLWGIVDLTNAHVGCLIDDPDSWPSKGNLRINGFTYESFESNTSTVYYDRLDWLERQYKPHLTDDFRPQPFEQLAKVLNATGRENEAKKIAISKLLYQRDANFVRRNRTATELSQKIRMTNNPINYFFLTAALREERKVTLDNIFLLCAASCSWLTSTAFWAFAGYGYRPARCIIWAILFIAIGAGVFSDLYDNGHITPASDNLMLDSPGDDAVSKTFYPTAYAADVFIPIIDFRQASKWDLFEGPIEPIRPFLLFYWGYILLGWVFAAIFGASITGLVRR